MKLLYGLVAALSPTPCPAPAPALREYSVDYGHTIVEFVPRTVVPGLERLQA